jgi:RNA polymerase sigma factor (sigma-70 family)
MSANTPDDILIARVLKGETSSFKMLVERYQNLVFTIAFRITNNREEAEEVAQDVFMKVYNGLADFKGESKFSSWLYRIAYNTALTKIRNRKQGFQALDNEHGEVTNEADQVFTREYLNKAINMLEPDEATVITLFYLSEQSLDEIAEVLSIAPNAVKVRLHRARKKLREKLELIG